MPNEVCEQPVDTVRLPIIVSSRKAPYEFRVPEPAVPGVGLFERGSEAWSIADLTDRDIRISGRWVDTATSPTGGTRGLYYSRPENEMLCRMPIPQPAEADSAFLYVYRSANFNAYVWTAVIYISTPHGELSVSVRSTVVDVRTLVGIARSVRIVRTPRPPVGLPSVGGRSTGAGAAR